MLRGNVLSQSSGSKNKHIAACWLAYSSTLKMGAVCSSESSVNYYHYTRLHGILLQRVVPLLFTPVRTSNLAWNFTSSGCSQKLDRDRFFLRDSDKINCTKVIKLLCRSQWPPCLRHELSSLARTLGSWDQIPVKAWMSVCVYSVFVLFCV
jgi:hypothetical protein